MKNKTDKMKFHDSCTLFPMLDRKELLALATDIKENGQRFPILTYDDQIVDGRNRYVACGMVGVEPKFQEISSKADVNTVVNSMNVLRRHLTTSQRAMIAAELVDAKEGRQPVATGGKKPVTSEDAAAMLSVSKDSVKVAKAVKEKGTPALKKAVKDGKVKLPKAARIAKLPKEKQDAEIDKPEPKPARGGLFAEKTRAEADKAYPTPTALRTDIEKLTEAIYDRYPASDHRNVTTIGEMVSSFLDIAAKVIG